MKSRIRQSVDRYGDPVWLVETKSKWLPWWRNRNWSTIKTKAENMAKILVNPEIIEFTK